MAQVIGGGPSLINNLINLIKAPSQNRFLRKAATEVACTDGIPGEAAAAEKCQENRYSNFMKTSACYFQMPLAVVGDMHW